MKSTINILVIDDEQIVLDSIAKHLKKENYQLHFVLSANDALEKMAEIEISIVLTDLMMPEIDGLELMKMVKDRNPNIPVIMITGYATINTALQATQLGAFDYVAKPFSKKELLSVVKRAAETISKQAEQVDNNESISEDTDKSKEQTFKIVGDHSWLMQEKDGTVLLGVERSFLHTIGKIQSVYLPKEGDEIRQGSVYFQIFSSDLRAHSIFSPLSGNVVKVNQKVLDDPATTLEDSYGEGWLIRLKPSRFEQEIKLLGL